MNAPFVAQPTKKQQLDRAMSWRGYFIQCFAQAEMLVGNCLQMFADASFSDAPVKSGLQIRGAVDEMRRLISFDGPYGDAGKSLLPSLLEVEAHLEWRPAFTHGEMDVWREGRAGWFIEFSYRECDSSGPVQWHALPISEAEELLAHFTAEVGKFRQRYSALADRLALNSQTPDRADTPSV